MAIEYSGKEGGVCSERIVDPKSESSDGDSEASDSQLSNSRATSTPKGGHRGKKRNKNDGSDSSDTLSLVGDNPVVAGHEHLDSQDKKLRLEGVTVLGQQPGEVVEGQEGQQHADQGRHCHYNKMAYDEIYSIFFACSQICQIIFHLKNI